jgi:hypothetical protein
MKYFIHKFLCHVHNILHPSDPPAFPCPYCNSILYPSKSLNQEKFFNYVCRLCSSSLILDHSQNFHSFHFIHPKYDVPFFKLSVFPDFAHLMKYDDDLSPPILIKSFSPAPHNISPKSFPKKLKTWLTFL